MNVISVLERSLIIINKPFGLHTHFKLFADSHSNSFQQQFQLSSAKRQTKQMLLSKKKTKELQALIYAAYATGQDTERQADKTVHGIMSGKKKLSGGLSLWVKMNP